jgi:soluble lytic murein transglycosylase-like protein
VATLRLAALVAAVLWAVPARAEPVDRWSPHIAEASRRFGVPADWIRRVMRAESGGRTMLDGRPITSRAGAMGLMQLMPGTWREMRAAYGLGRNPYDPRDNILAGTAYLRAMYDRFGYPGLFAAYNAGPARYAGHLATGRRLPPETSAYMAMLAGAGSNPSTTAQPAGRRDSVFFKLAAAAPNGSTSAARPAPPSNPLFVTLATAQTLPQ